MYTIEFYEDKNGRSEIEEYLKQLQNNPNKDNNIKFKKITSYIDNLSIYGLSLGEPYIKHLDNEIWELRPIRDRILFASWCNNKFILLNIFMKQTQKTPQREIEKARRMLEDCMKRRDKGE